MANEVFNSFKGKMDGSFAWGDNATTVIKAMLVTVDYTPNIDTHVFKSDVTNEAVGTGYTAGGQAIVNRTITINNTLDLAVYDGDDLQWTPATITARGAVLYKDTGVAGTSPLIAYIDFNVDKVSSSGDFDITWNVDGIFRVA